MRRLAVRSRRARRQPTIGDWAKEWLRLAVHLKPQSRAMYESIVRSRIVPRFGSMRLDAIDTLAVRRWVADMSGERLSAGRVRQSLQLLSQILASAVNCRLLLANPCAGVRFPREVLPDIAPLTAQEVERLADCVPKQYRALIHVLAYGGLRWGEASALRRKRCDQDAGALVVAESIGDVNGALIFGQTKAYRVRRTRIPAFLVDELREHLTTIATAPDTLVFTAPRGGPLRMSNFRSRVWVPALEAAALPPSTRVHDLRHTCASLLIREGVHPKAVQHHLGHSSIDNTMDRYGHLFADEFDDLANRLERVHGERSAPQNDEPLSA